jgi:hypothetical protein
MAEMLGLKKVTKDSCELAPSQFQEPEKIITPREFMDLLPAGFRS